MFFVRLFDLRLFGLSVSSNSWCLGRATVCDCGTPWTFLLPLFFISAANRTDSAVGLLHGLQREYKSSKEDGKCI